MGEKALTTELWNCLIWKRSVRLSPTINPALNQAPSMASSSSPARLWLWDCFREHPAQAAALGCYSHSRTLPLEASTAGRGGQREKRVLEKQVASGSPFHHAADGEAPSAKPPSRANPVWLRKQHTYINARVASVSWLPLWMEKRKHVRLDK